MEGGWEMSLSEENRLTAMKLCRCRVAHCLVQFCKRENTSLGRDDALSHRRSLEGALVYVREHAWTLCECTFGHT